MMISTNSFEYNLLRIETSDGRVIILKKEDLRIIDGECYYPRYSKIDLPPSFSEGITKGKRIGSKGLWFEEDEDHYLLDSGDGKSLRFHGNEVSNLANTDSYGYDAHLFLKGRRLFLEEEYNLEMSGREGLCITANTMEDHDAMLFVLTNWIWNPSWSLLSHNRHLKLIIVVSKGDDSRLGPPINKYPGLQ